MSGKHMDGGKKILAGVSTCIIGSIIVFCARAATTATKAAAQPPIPKVGSLAQPRSVQQVGLPADLTRTIIPPDNPQTPEKNALGQKLFFDGRLSADGSVACASCHNPDRAFTDGKPTSVGIHAKVGQRNAPTILNALYNKAQFWDGRAKTLEDQAALPIINPIEMGQPNLNAAVTRLAAIDEYQQAFKRVFGRPINGQDLVRAIASYERTLVSFNSPFDRFIAGDENAIDASAQRGWELFNTKALCNKCHALTETKRDPVLFMDYDFHNIGIGIIRHDVVALARQAEQLVNSGDAAAVDRAGLRNLLMTRPYFHDGSQETLWDAMDHYNKGDGLQNTWLDEDIQPLALTENEIDDVVAFLASLTSDEYKEAAAKELARQRALSRTTRPQRDTARAFGPKPTQPAPPRP